MDSSFVQSSSGLGVDCVVASVRAAAEAGLTYVTDFTPGIRRIRDQDSFIYIQPDGKPIDNPAIIDRIQKLVIPPAYEDVWICPDENGHLQATGRDAKGRKQYRYHPQWRQHRDGNKFDRMIEFGLTLPKIRQQVEHDLNRKGIPRQKILATIVRLLEVTRIRVGSEEYARENHTYGLTTLSNEHVEIDKTTLHFHFRGKSGKNWSIDIKNRKLASIVRQSSELNGQHLFEYVDSDGKPHSVSSSDVNDYIREISGSGFTAKDFRTWAGTVLAMRYLSHADPATSQSAGRKAVSSAVKAVSEHLGNTPAVCRKCYIHPTVIDSYLSNSISYLTVDRAEQTAGRLEDEESAVLSLLLGARASASDAEYSTRLSNC